MKPSLDRALKMTWLGIGAIVLLFLLGGLVLVLSQATRNAGAAQDAARVASADTVDARRPVMVRYGMPDSIAGTQTRIVRVHDGRAQGRRFSVESSDYSRSDTDVNVMFVDAQGVRLLLDRPAYIRDISYPRTAEKDAPRAWISYVAALDDTDRSGRVDASDDPALYVTDLDGRNLRPVLGPPLRYRSHAALDATRILVYALEGSGRDEARMRQRAFIYDVRAGQLAPYAAMDAAAARAGQVLRR